MDRQAALLAAPGLARATWLPEGEWQDLDELRAEHARLLADRRQVAAEFQEARRGFEEEDEQCASALRDGYAAGEQVELPEVTSPPEREAVLAPLRARREAITEALGAFLARAEQTITERCDGYLADLDGRDAEVKERADAARAILAEAQREVESRRALRLWLLRTAGRHPMFRDHVGRHIPFEEVPVPPVGMDEERLKEAVHG